MVLCIWVFFLFWAQDDNFSNPSSGPSSQNTAQYSAWLEVELWFCDFCLWWHGLVQILVLPKLYNVLSALGNGLWVYHLAIYSSLYCVSQREKSCIEGSILISFRSQGLKVFFTCLYNLHAAMTKEVASDNLMVGSREVAYLKRVKSPVSVRVIFLLRLPPSRTN